MISFDEFLKQDDEEKYNNMQYDIFEIQALKNELENRDIYISKLEVAYSKEIERLNNIINELEKYLIEQVEKSYSNDYDNVLDKLDELKGDESNE